MADYYDEIRKSAPYQSLLRRETFPQSWQSTEGRVTELDNHSKYSRGIAVKLEGLDKEDIESKLIEIARREWQPDAERIPSTLEGVYFIGTDLSKLRLEYSGDMLRVAPLSAGSRKIDTVLHHFKKYVNSK